MSTRLLRQLLARAVESITGRPRSQRNPERAMFTPQMLIRFQPRGSKSHRDTIGSGDDRRGL